MTEKRRVYANRVCGGWVLYEDGLPFRSEDVAREVFFVRRVYPTRGQAESTARRYGFAICPSPEERARRLFALVGGRRR